MADQQTPTAEVLRLQLQVAQLQAQMLGLQAQLARYQHMELMQEASRLQQALQAAQKAEGEPVDVPSMQAAKAPGLRQ